MAEGSRGHTRGNRAVKSPIPARGKVRRIKGALLVALALVPACGNDSSDIPKVDAARSISVSSSAFGDGDTIPAAFTCDGDETSPPLEWARVSGAREYAVTVTDADAPGGTFVHWVVWDIPSSTTELSAGGVPDEAVQGTNGFGNGSYGGPCPPEGDAPHRYAFTVYALRSDATAGLAEGASLEDLVDAISCCAIGEGTLTGRYER